MKVVFCNRLKSLELCLGKISSLKSSFDLEDGTVLVACSKTNAKTTDNLVDRTFYYNSSLFFPDNISGCLVGLVSIRKIEDTASWEKSNIIGYEILDYMSFTNITTLKKDDYKVIETSQWSNLEDDTNSIAEFLASIPSGSEKLSYRLPVINNGYLYVFVGSTVLNNLKKFHNGYTDKFCISFVCRRKDMINYFSDDGSRCKIPLDIIICRSEHDKDSLSFKIDSSSWDNADLDGSFYTEIEDGCWMFVLHEQ